MATEYEQLVKNILRVLAETQQEFVKITLKGNWKCRNKKSMQIFLQVYLIYYVKPKGQTISKDCRAWTIDKEYFKEDFQNFVCPC